MMKNKFLKGLRAFLREQRRFVEDVSNKDKAVCTICRLSRMGRGGDGCE